jgi:hypothetical protein
MEALERHAPPKAAPLGDIEQLLGACDLVKFAKAGSTDDEAVRALESAEAVVLATSIPVPAADEPFPVIPIAGEHADGEAAGSRTESAGG